MRGKYPGHPLLQVLRLPVADWLPFPDTVRVVVEAVYCYVCCKREVEGGVVGSSLEAC